MIATLHSGAALANTSARQCVNQADVDNPAGLVDAGDGWMRVQVTEYLFEKNGQQYWLTDDPTAPNNGGEGIYYADADQDGDGLGDPYDVTAANGWTLPPLQSRTRFALIMYQTDGYTVTPAGSHPRLYFPNNTTATPLTASCLASFA